MALLHFIVSLGSDNLFVPYIPVPDSPAEVYDRSSWIKHDGMPMWPPEPVQAGVVRKETWDGR